VIQKFLKAKHWQIFFLYLISPLISIIAFIIMVNIDFNNGRNSDDTVLVLFKYIMWFATVSVFIRLAWNWSVTISLCDQISDLIKPKLGLFQASILYSIIYHLALSTVCMNFVSTAQSASKTGVIEDYPFEIFLIIPFHFVAIIAFIYLTYITAKTIKTAELGKRVKLNAFIGEFLWVWIFVIGIWVIQPRVNRLEDKTIA